MSRTTRLLDVAWTTGVVLCATLALIGIVWFMAGLHGAVGALGPSTGSGFDERALPADPTPDSRFPPDTSGGYIGRGSRSPIPDPRSASAVIDLLRARSLAIPVMGVQPAALAPSFEQARGSRRHEALDIMAPRGTPVQAVEDGSIAKLFTSEAGGLTVYQFDPTRSVAYYYAHLDRYADKLSEGDAVYRGQLLGFVGSTGNAEQDAPHLHFAIFRLGPEQRWWEGEAVDPYRVFTR